MSIRAFDSIQSITSTEFFNAVNQRLNELEIKASFHDDTLETLNTIVIRQQSEIAALVGEVVALRKALAQKDANRPTNSSQELPPHY